MKPKILLSVGANKENYLMAVKSVGGDPFASYLPAVDLSFDGLILGGGPDLHPKFYGEEILGSKNIDEARDEAEFLLAEAFVNAGKPVMGICRGAQLLNVYFGGTLHQHIDSAAFHCPEGDFDLVHKVISGKQSILESLYGKEFSVNSFHHQAVDILGEGLIIAAKEKETGVVEAFEHKTLPIFALQWHPERMCFLNKRTDTVDGAAVFAHYLRLCEGR